MDISLLTKDHLWATATALVDRIGFEDGYEAIRGIIAEPKQVASIARRVVAEVYPVSIHAPAWGATAVLFFTIIALFFVLYFAKPKKGLRFQGPKTLWSIISHYYC